MKAIRHFGIVVQDIEKSLHFYRDLLGLKIKKEMLEEGEFIDAILGLKGVKVRTIKMAAESGDTLVEILGYQSHKGKRRDDYKIFDLGASHVAFTVSDLEEEYARLQNEGVAFINSPQISPGGRKVAFCLDPDGVPIELVQELH